MKPKAPKRIWIDQVRDYRPAFSWVVCKTKEHDNCSEYLRADAVKRKPLPKRLRVAAELWISELAQVNGCEESVYILKELLRRAGGK